MKLVYSWDTRTDRKPVRNKLYVERGFGLPPTIWFWVDYNSALIMDGEVIETAFNVANYNMSPKTDDHSLRRRRRTKFVE